MYFDTLTLATVVSELRATIIDGRIQRAILISPLSIALEIYGSGRRQYVLLSAHPQFPRLHVTKTRPSRGVEGDTQLLLLLRKYVVGGWIVELEQPDLERVVVLSIAKGPRVRNLADNPDDMDEGDDVDELLRCELVVELMERRGNIVLVSDQNIILESARHISPRVSRRPVQPHEPYELPPRQNKRDPRSASASDLPALATDADASDLAQELVKLYRGLSPQVAREIVFRVFGHVDVKIGPDLPWARIAATMRELWNAAPEPCLALGDAGPLAFAPYLLTQYEHVERQPTMSAALDAFYVSREAIAGHSQRREALAERLAEAHGRLSRQRQQLLDELQRAAELDRLRWEGEMIYAFMSTLAPGQIVFEVDDRTITLDAKRSFVENAQDRFRAYDKAKNAVKHVPEHLHAVEARIAGLDQLMALLELAEGYDQIEELGREAIEHGYLKAETTRKPKGRRLPPLRIESSDNFSIYVGRSAGQNEQVTFKIATPDDLWLHAHGIPGAHVVIKNGGREVPERTLLEAAGLAAYYSKGRTESNVDVDITRRRHVRRVPDGPLGLVTIRGERTMRVAPRVLIPSVSGT